MMQPGRRWQKRQGQKAPAHSSPQLAASGSLQVRTAAHLPENDPDALGDHQSSLRLLSPSVLLVQRFQVELTQAGLPCQFAVLSTGLFLDQSLYSDLIQTWPQDQINKEQVIPSCENFPGTLGRKILYPISIENWTREKPHLGGEKEKPKMAYPFLASVTSDFESKIIYIFSKNINLEYCCCCSVPQNNLILLQSKWQK